MNNPSQICCDSINEEDQFSFYRNQQPATEKEIDSILGSLIVNYHTKPKEFWLELKKFLIRKGWSKDRLQYAADKLVDEQVYHNWVFADLVAKDREIKKWTTAEAESIPVPHRPLALTNFGEGMWRVCYKEDAERLGLEHKVWITQAEKDYYNKQKEGEE